jgi:hypothetical protein
MRIARRQVHTEQFAAVVGDQMELEAEKPVHTGLAAAGASG